jgi:hypothetical protein
VSIKYDQRVKDAHLREGKESDSCQACANRYSHALAATNVKAVVVCIPVELAWESQASADTAHYLSDELEKK